MLKYADVCCQSSAREQFTFKKKKCDLVLRFECAAAYNIVHRLLCVCVCVCVCVASEGGGVGVY